MYKYRKIREVQHGTKLGTQNSNWKSFKLTKLQIRRQASTVMFQRARNLLC